MLCTAARLLIFWILNIAFIPIVLTLGKKAVFGEFIKAQRESVQLNARPAFEQANPHNNNQMGYMIGAGVIRDNGHHAENEVITIDSALCSVAIKSSFENRLLFSVTKR